MNLRYKARMPLAARARHARIRRARRALAALVFALPAFACLAVDRLRRADHLRALDPEGRRMHLITSALGLCVLAGLLVAASRRRGRMRGVAAVAFVVTAMLAVGGQAYFHEHYHAYLTIEASVFTKDLWGTVGMHYLADPAGHLRVLALPSALAILLVLAGRKVVRARRAPAMVGIAIAPALVVASHFLPEGVVSAQAASPEALFFQATTGFARTLVGSGEHARKDRPRVRSPRPLPPLEPQAGGPRNVLFVLLESTRADAVCAAPGAACAFTPHTNALLPDRFPLTQMRALDSTTVISTVVLLSGLGPEEDRETLHTWPWLFDYARSAGYHTAYWTSQDVFFGNLYLLRHRLGLSSYLTAKHVESPLEDADVGAPEDKLADRVIAEMGNLKEPFFAVLHLSNTHYPYHASSAFPRPFAPEGASPGDREGFRRHYQDSIWQSDLHLSRVLAALRGSEAGRRTAIVYTSDHGEAFQERGHGGHIFSVYDEEIRVPAWIDAPPGLLSEAQASSLRARRGDRVFHTDVTPTILDFMGLWDRPALAELRRRLPGQSLLRPSAPRAPMLMTNCSALWSCWSENWGAMHGSRKLFARAWDGAFRCYDVDTDPGEEHDLGAAACPDLLALTMGKFGRLPRKTP